MDTLPLGQCVSLLLELVSITYQHKYTERQYMYDNKDTVAFIEKDRYVYNRVVQTLRVHSVVINGVELEEISKTGACLTECLCCVNANNVSVTIANI